MHNICAAVADATAATAVQEAASAGRDRGVAWEAAHAAVAACQADLLRECFGNPFRPMTVRPGWLAWNGGIVRRLAQAIYQDGTFDRLPVLADALEEAGCSDTDILAHCRRGEHHVRGCWVVDQLLGQS